MKSILIVEDTKEYQILIKQTLENRFNLTFASTVSEAINIINKKNFDLFILDIMLPDEDGFHLCSQIRNNQATEDLPIVFLTGKSDLKDKIMGFALGGDDYIIKPFEPLELRARIDAKINRHTQKKTKEQVLLIGDIKIVIPFQKAYLTSNVEEKDLELTPNEFRLLYYIVRHEGHVLSRNKLLDALWGDRINVTDRTVDTHIYTLRKKLASKAHYIESVQGEGYRFTLR